MILKPAPVRRPGAFGLSKTELALSLAVLSVGLCLVVAVIPPTLFPFKGERLQPLNPFLIERMDTFDTSWQRAAHLILITFLAACVLGSDKIVKFWKLATHSRLAALIARSLVTATIISFLVGTSLQTWGIFPGAPLLIAVINICLLVALRQVNHGLAARISMVGSLAVMCLSVLPGLITKPDLSWMPPDSITDVQQHYTMVVAQADRIGIGQRLFEQVGPDYGTLLPLLFGAWQRHFGVLSFGAFILCMRWLDLAYLSMAALLYWRLSRARALPAFLALCTVVPWYQFNHFSIYFPNHCAWRFIGMPVALLSVYLCRRFLPATQYCILGAISVLSILINCETGIAISAGLITYAHFRFRTPLDVTYPVRSIDFWGRFLAGVLAGAALLGLLQYLLLGYLSYPASYLSIFRISGMVARTGYTGLPIYFAPIAVLMLVHASFVLLRAAFISSQPLSFPASFRAAVAGTILLWFAYWFNRPHFRDLSSFYFLYGFLLMDLVNIAFAKSNLHNVKSRMLLASAMIILSLVVIPDTVGSYRFSWPYYDLGWSSAMRQLGILPPADEPGWSEPSSVISGVLMSREVVQELAAKSNFIRQRSAREPAMYLTANSYLIPKLSGVYSPLVLRFRDTFMGVVMREDMQSLVNQLLNASCRQIYFDCPHSLTPGMPVCRQYYNWLRNRIRGRWYPTTCVEGWEIWERKL